MNKRVCPWWLGYTLIIPFRRLQYDPRKLLAPYVHEGMTVIEPDRVWATLRWNSLGSLERQGVW